jgi:hypothetical protein
MTGKTGRTIDLSTRLYSWLNDLDYGFFGDNLGSRFGLLIDRLGLSGP